MCDKGKKHQILYIQILFDSQFSSTLSDDIDDNGQWQKTTKLRRTTVQSKLTWTNIWLPWLHDYIQNHIKYQKIAAARMTSEY